MPDFEATPDNDLVTAFRNGDADAFAEIYDRYAGMVFSHFLVGEGRDEAIQATYETFMEAADRLQDSNPADLAGWLLGVAGERTGLPGPPDVPGEPVAAPPALRARVLGQVDDAMTARIEPTSSGRSLPSDWMMLGVFAAVTLVLGLIGVALAGQFEPIEPPTTVPTVEGTADRVGSSTTTTSISGTATTTTGAVGGTSTSVTTGGGAAALQASTDTINLDGDATVGEFDLTNNGDRAGQWTLAVSTDAIAVSSGGGELAAGETVTIEMSLDRGRIEEGEFAETITVTWDGGEIPIGVVGSEEANPIIHNPRANPPSVEVSGAAGCTNTKTTVSVRVTDASPLESVVVRWSPDGGGQQETAMSPVGGDVFEAVVGPFTVAQSAELRVVAFDERGNAGGASAILTVVACP